MHDKIYITNQGLPSKMGLLFDKSDVDIIYKYYFRYAQVYFELHTLFDTMRHKLLIIGET